MRLEPELWDALQEICERERLSLGEIVRRIEKRGHPGGRTSAVRVHVLNYFRDAATEAGHQTAGHGDALAGKDPSPTTVRDASTHEGAPRAEA